MIDIEWRICWIEERISCWKFAETQPLPKHNLGISQKTHFIGKIYGVSFPIRIFSVCVYSMKKWNSNNFFFSLSLSLSRFNNFFDCYEGLVFQLLVLHFLMSYYQEFESNEIFGILFSVVLLLVFFMVCLLVSVVQVLPKCVSNTRIHIPDLILWWRSQKGFIYNDIQHSFWLPFRSYTEFQKVQLSVLLFLFGSLEMVFSFWPLINPSQQEISEDIFWIGNKGITTQIVRMRNWKTWDIFF
jgi:hypothetical protein